MQLKDKKTDGYYMHTNSYIKTTMHYNQNVTGIQIKNLSTCISYFRFNCLICELAGLNIGIRKTLSSVRTCYLTFDHTYIS